MASECSATTAPLVIMTGHQLHPRRVSGRIGATTGVAASCNVRLRSATNYRFVAEAVANGSRGSGTNAIVH